MKIRVSTPVAGFAAAMSLVCLVSATSAGAAPFATPKAKTCAAFFTWERHPSKAHLDTMMADSFNVPWKYLGEDITSLYSDVRNGSVKYVKSDERYIASDCKG